MEFRIIKTRARPDTSYPYKYSYTDWFIVQYRKEPSFWNLWHPKWKNLKYNQEEFLRYNSCTEPQIWSMSCSHTWSSGSLIPTYELALRLLDMFRYKNDLLGDVKEEVVYQTKTSEEPAKANGLAREYDYLVNGDSTAEKPVVSAAASELDGYTNPPVRKKHRKKSDD